MIFMTMLKFYRSWFSVIIGPVLKLSKLLYVRFEYLCSKNLDQKITCKKSTNKEYL